MRHFELKAGGTTKLWSIDQRGTTIGVKWGVVGGLMKAHDRHHADEDEASAKLEEMIAARLKEGYVEVSDPASAPIKEERWARRYENRWSFLEVVLDGRRVQQRRGATRVLVSDPDEDKQETVQVFEHPNVKDAREVVERIIKHAMKRDDYVLVSESDPPPIVMPGTSTLPGNPELEALCRADPDNEATWAVYADWLMAHDDPRGQIAAFRMNKRATEGDRAFNASRLALFGHHGELLQAAEVTAWHHGFATSVGLKLTYDTSAILKLGELTAALLESPVGAFVDSLRFGLAGYQSNNDWGPTIDAVARSPRAAQIRELRFDDFNANDCELSWAAFGDFSKAWSKLPALEALHIRSGAGGVLGAIKLPKLRTFVRESGGLRATEIASICDAKWPKLEHLEIWFGAADHGAEGSVDSIRKILDGGGLRSLKYLGLCNSEFVDALIGALVESKIIKQLHTLDLSKGIMASAANRAMIEHAAAFRHLAKIDLRANVLTDAEVREIVAVLPNVVATEQRGREIVEDDDDDAGDRYVAVGE